MAKHQKSIYLESDIIKYLDKYVEEHELSNLSTAIERIVLERKYGYTDRAVDNVDSSKDDKGTQHKKLPPSLANIRDSMKD